MKKRRYKLRKIHLFSSSLLIFFSGIDANIRDCQGRTALDVLREHPSQKSQQIASLIQGKAFARHTRTRIKTFLKQKKPLNTQAHSHTRAQANEGTLSWLRSEGGCLQIDKSSFQEVCVRLRTMVV